VFPQFAGVAVDGAAVDGNTVGFRVRATAGDAPCPCCGQRSDRVHARYLRKLADLPIGGRRTRIVMSVRRFKCVNPCCPQATFSEQIAGLTIPFARRTALLTEALAEIALTLAGRAGSRLAKELAMPCCRDVLIRLIRARPLPKAGRIEVLGVDDFAFRRGHTYGTVLIDMDTHRPVDVLADREADTLTAWLREHPEIRVVCRDRAGAYAEAIRAGAPQATEVADRFHLWQNLCQAAGKTVAAHHHCLSADPSQTQGAPALPPREYPLAARTRARHAAVHDLLARGRSRNAIARELNLDIQTVRRFANAGSAQELLAKAEQRPTKLDPFIDLVNQRWNEGVATARAIHAELRTLGFTGTANIVERYLRPLRPGGDGRRRGQGAPAPTSRAIPKPRRINRALLTHPDNLTDHDKQTLARATGDCPHLRRLHAHIRSFAKIMAGRRGHEPTTWLDAVEADDLPELHRFATGIRRDLTAVINGLTTEHSSGAVEGNVTRIKKLKRDGYGRANFDLLKARILLAT
jgi:transposase